MRSFCEPSVGDGDVQGAARSPSSEQVNVAARASAVNANVASLAATVPAGPLVIVTVSAAGVRRVPTGDANEDRYQRDQTQGTCVRAHGGSTS